MKEKFYTCYKCLYTFKSEKDITTCPDCGKPAIRVATPKEIAAWFDYRKEDDSGQ